MKKVLRMARQRGCFLELNKHAIRLHLSDMNCRATEDTGVMVSIISDAHSTQQLDNLDLELAMLVADGCKLALS